MVVWQSRTQDGNGKGVFAQRHSSAGQRQGTEFRINSYTTGDQSSPAIVTVPSGFVVAWSDFDRHLILAQRYASDGTTLGTEITANTDSDLNSPSPFLAADDNGRFLVLWNNTNASTLYSRFFESDGAPVTGTQIAVNANTTVDHFDPQALVLPSGEFQVVWVGMDLGGKFGPSPSSSYLLSRTLGTNGNPTGSEFMVNNYTTGITESPSMTATDSGFTVVWTNDSVIDDSGRISGQRLLNSGAKVGSEFHVNAETTGTQLFPEVTADGHGGFVVVWHDSNYNPSWNIIKGKHFNSSASPTNTFQVNTSTEIPNNPAIDSDPNGDFVVTWDSDQDGSDAGILGQRFASHIIFNDGFESGDLTQWSATEPPTVLPGDECTAPFLLGDNIPSTGDLSDNTASGAADTCGTNNTIDEWLVYTAPCTGTVTITTCRPGTDVDTILSAWDSCGGSELDCNDDDPMTNDPNCDLGGFNRKSTISFSVTSGGSYFIRASAYEDDFVAGSNFDINAVCQ